MSTSPVPEQAGQRGPEISKLKRQPEAKPIEAPIGPTEQAMVRRIKQDRDPDNVLQDIASEKVAARVPEAQSELPPITFQIDNSNPHRSKFWEHIHRTAIINPEFADRAKVASPDILPALVLQELAGRLKSDHSILENPSRVAKEFVNWITKGDWEVDRAVWDNFQMRNAVLDALLVRADREATDGGDSTKQKEIRLARELIRTSGYLSAVYIGTSSAALPGIEQASARILSVGKLQEKGIIRRTGEGTRGGATAEGVLGQGISATTLFETADSYADLNATTYYQTPEKALAEIDKINAQTAEVNEYSKDSNLSQENKDWVQRRLGELTDARLVTQQQYEQLQSGESSPPEDVFPIVFGLDEIPIVKHENNGLYAFRTEHKVPLRDKLRNVYVPVERIPIIKAWLSSIDINKRNVLPLEAMRSVREMDPHLDRDRERVRDNANFIKHMHKTGATT